jgi:hypothetical protein
VGVSIFSEGVAVGTVSAGVAYNSQGVAVASLGAGAAKDSMGAAAGTVGVGAVDESAVAAAGTAGVGTAEKVEGAAAGTAGAGEAENVKGTANATAGTGKVKDVEGDASGKGDTEGVTGDPGAGDQPEARGDKARGEGVGKGSQPRRQPGEGEGKGGKPGPGKGVGQPGGTTQSGTGVDLQALLATPEGRAILAEAAAMAKLLEAASAEQRSLVEALAANSPSGTRPVATAGWMEMLLAATRGLTPYEIEKLKRLNWVPAENVTAEKLKKQVQAALTRPEAEAAGAPAKPVGKAGERPGDPKKEAGAATSGQGGGDRKGMGSAGKDKEGHKGEGTGGSQPGAPGGGKVERRGLKPGEEVIQPTTSVSVSSPDSRVKNGHAFAVGFEDTIAFRYDIPGFGVQPVNLKVRVTKTDPLTFEVTETAVLEKKEGKAIVTKHIGAGVTITFSFKPR